MAARGRFIVFEGGEGSGKSTQAAVLAERLGALLTREPGGTPLGEALRALALDPAMGSVDPRTELLLMAASRAAHVQQVILPALERGRDVVCDRFNGSTVAYQGYGRGLPIEDVLVACALATDGLEPDLYVLLDVEAELAARRRHGASNDRIEAAGAAFHARVREGFRQLAAVAPTRWVVLDGSGEVEAVARLVEDALADRFGERPGMAP